MARLRSLGVFCGSAAGEAPIHAEAAKRLGRLLAEAGVRLVYGGGRVGLMGLLAEAVLTAGGEAVGVIPDPLVRRELAYRGLTELIVVPTMHDRKRRMFELADAFCVLPGGLGTLDETFEILTWKQLGLHDKPVILADIGGYWGGLVRLLEAIERDGFASAPPARLFVLVDDVDHVLAAIEAGPGPKRPGRPGLF